MACSAIPKCQFWGLSVNQELTFFPPFFLTKKIKLIFFFTLGKLYFHIYIYIRALLEKENNTNSFPIYHWICETHIRSHKFNNKFETWCNTPIPQRVYRTYISLNNSYLNIC